MQPFLVLFNLLTTINAATRVCKLENKKSQVLFKSIDQHTRKLSKTTQILSFVACIIFLTQYLRFTRVKKNCHIPQNEFSERSCLRFHHFRDFHIHRSQNNLIHFYDICRCLWCTSYLQLQTFKWIIDIRTGVKNVIIDFRNFSFWLKLQCSC